MGAFVSLYGSPANVAEDARIGLAAPCGAQARQSLASPCPPLTRRVGPARHRAHDRVYQSVQSDAGVDAQQRQRLYWLGLAAVLWYVTGAGLFILLMVGAAYQILWKKDHAPVPDQARFSNSRGILALFGALLKWIPKGY